MRNKERFKKEIRALRTVLMDEPYCKSLGSFHTFVADMHVALVSDRMITDKMQNSIQKIINNYHRLNQPEVRTKRLQIMDKMDMLSKKLEQCDYHKLYRMEKQEVIDSMKRWASRTGKLTKGQMVYCNKLFKQFNKKIQKST